MIGHCLPALVGVEDEVLAAGVDAADGSRGQRRACIHKDPLFVHKIAAAEGRAAFDGQVGDRLKEARVAAFIVLKGKDLTGRVQGGVEVLQGRAFRLRSWGKGPDPARRSVALQKAPGRHAAGSFISAKCLPVPAPPVSSTTLRAPGVPCPAQRGGASPAPRSTKASCPRTVFFTSSASPSKLPRCSGFASAVPLASRPSSSRSRSILRLSSSADVCGGVLALSGPHSAV